MPTIKKILVPVDFSAASLAGLEFAADLARTLRASLEVLHVVEIATYAPMMGVSVDLRRLREGHEQAALARLEKLAAALGTRGVRCGAAIKIGIAPYAIVDEAERSGADLVVMATHGRHGVERLLIGSVAERVVRAAGCPVLTVRAGRRRTRRTSAKPRAARGSKRSR